jgi:curved DNA-binding protein CbpA
MTYTYYDFLDLAPGASTARIDAAYAQILERFGYGVTDAGQDLSGLVRQIHAAYEVLSDPDKRERYDADLERAARAADLELKEALDQAAPRRVWRRTFRLRCQHLPVARRVTPRARSSHGKCATCHYYDRRHARGQTAAVRVPGRAGAARRC